MSEARFVIVSNSHDVVHQLKMSHVDRFAHPAGILPAVVMLGQLQMLIELSTLREGHLALRACDKCFSDRSSLIPVWVLHRFLPDNFFLTRDGVFAADQTLPVSLVVRCDAQDEASLMIVMTTFEVNQLRAALVESVLADRAYLCLVKVLNLMLEPCIDLAQLTQLRGRQVLLDLVSLCAIGLLRDDRVTTAGALLIDRLSLTVVADLYPTRR